MIFPGGKIPDGASPEAIYMKRLERVAREITQPGQVSGRRMSRTTQGDFMAPSDESIPSDSLVLAMYILRDVQDDYLVCHSWDPSLAEEKREGTKDIYIAKEKAHRTSRDGDTILGTDYTYTYDDGPSEDWTIETDTRFNLVRHSDDGSTTEDQRIVPPWMDGEIFYAIPAKTDATHPKSEEDSTPVKITLLIAGRSTMWAKKRG